MLILKPWLISTYININDKINFKMLLLKFKYLMFKTNPTPNLGVSEAECFRPVDDRLPTMGPCAVGPLTEPEPAGRL